ncbi:MAG: tetratricopeptide repeat protein [Undibacterium sp.]|nr:tetratricopeptide repeat protein [Undibacterium sp.]
MKNFFTRIVTIVAKFKWISPIRWITSASLIVILSGCANLSSIAEHTPDEMQQAHEATKNALEAEKAIEGGGMPPSEDKLPSVALTEELLYKLLTSEIAYQRGNWQAAYVTILGVAQQTRDPRLARRAAEMALSAKQPAESLSAIRLWRELAPESNEANQYYLGFMIMNNNLAEVQRVLSEKLQNSSPKQYGAVMLQAQRMLARARDKKAAFDILEEILAPYKSTAEAHLAIAQGAYGNGDNIRAIAEAKMALKIKPDSQLAILTIAQASKKSDAAKAMDAFLEANPTARDVRLAYASMLIELKHLNKAKNEFELLLRDKPNDAPTIYTLGAIAMETHQYKIAEKYFLAYLSILEENPAEERDPTAALVNLAQIALEQKNTPAAMGWLAKVESYDGKNPVWLNVQIRRAQLLAIDGKLPEARQFLRNVKTDSEPEQIQLLQAETQLLRSAKQAQEAMAVMEEAVKRFPTSPDLLYDYAMLAESQKKFAEMEATLKRVIELAPNSQHAYNALGYSYAERNIHLDEALTLIEKALQLAPDDPFILDSFGWVKFRLSKPEEAEQALRRAYQLRPDPEIAIHLGEVLWSIDQKEEARQLWRDAKTKDPENETLKKTLSRLNTRL